MKELSCGFLKHVIRRVSVTDSHGVRSHALACYTGDEIPVKLFFFLFIHLLEFFQTGYILLQSLWLAQPLPVVFVVNLCHKHNLTKSDRVRNEFDITNHEPGLENSVGEHVHFELFLCPKFVHQAEHL